MGKLSLYSRCWQPPWSPASAGAAGAKELLFSIIGAPKHVMNSVMFPEWTRGVEEATGGKVKLKILLKAVAPPPRLYDATTQGVTDSAVIMNAFIQRRAPLVQVSMLPFTVHRCRGARRRAVADAAEILRQGEDQRIRRRSAPRVHLRHGRPDVQPQGADPEPRLPAQAEALVAAGRRGQDAVGAQGRGGAGTRGAECIRSSPRARWTAGHRSR